jgi:HemY protein
MISAMLQSFWRKLFWWLLMLVLAVCAVWLLSNNAGYVLIIRPPYRVQFSFNLLLVLMVLGFLCTHLFLQLVQLLRYLPSRRRAKQETKRLKASHAALLQGIHALAEGNFISAEAAVQHAHNLIQDASHEKLIAALASEKNKQGFLFK